LLKQKLQWRGDKKNKNYFNQYLTSSEFRQRVQTILETCIELKEDLDNEMRAMQKYGQKEKNK